MLKVMIEGTQTLGWFNVRLEEATFHVGAVDSTTAEEATLHHIALQPGSFGLNVLAGVFVEPLPEADQPFDSVLATYTNRSRLAPLVILRGMSRQDNLAI
jgi:hypothetical protein